MATIQTTHLVAASLCRGVQRAIHHTATQRRVYSPIRPPTQRILPVASSEHVVGAKTETGQYPEAETHKQSDP